MGWKTTGRMRSWGTISYFSTTDLQGPRHTQKYVRITVVRGKDVSQKPPEYFTRLQVPLRTVLLEKPVVAQFLKKFPRERLLKCFRKKPSRCVLILYITLLLYIYNKIYISVNTTI